MMPIYIVGTFWNGRCADINMQVEKRNCKETKIKKSKAIPVTGLGGL
jgi:hypothetical protein